MPTSLLSRILGAISGALRTTAQERAAPRPVDDSPGRSGVAATVEVNASAVGSPRMTYSPVTDGDPDPGEIVWTWVPFEERDGRGKDRPVLIVAEAPGSGFLAVQLTSKPHDGHHGDFVSIGVGPWDAQGRASWVNIDRVFLVQTAGMRREAAALDAVRFTTVAAALRKRYGWRSA
ncbi:MAG TPA: type II toxin-antitoxin system PemK/MazF family toxin [Microbacteriaceae bacterium]|nr:type II toxin-antitoxin system PemK/MazF family toxin [Microbacteriaceae bacterium]